MNRLLTRKFYKNYKVKLKKVTSLSSYWSFLLSIRNKVMSEIGEIPIERDDLIPLSAQDKANFVENLQAGDIVLVGGLHFFSSIAIGGVLTHTTLYIGNNNFIHSMKNGVVIIKLAELLAKYDTIAIIRPQYETPAQLEATIAFTISKLGLPYDYDFKNNNDDKETYYCSELIVSALTASGYSLQLDDSGKFKSSLGGLAKRKAIHPMALINGVGEAVFFSGNVSYELDQDGSLTNFTLA